MYTYIYSSIICMYIYDHTCVCRHLGHFQVPQWWQSSWRHGTWLRDLPAPEEPRSKWQDCRNPTWKVWETMGKTYKTRKNMENYGKHMGRIWKNPRKLHKNLHESLLSICKNNSLAWRCFQQWGHGATTFQSYGVAYGDNKWYGGYKPSIIWLVVSTPWKTWKSNGIMTFPTEWKVIIQPCSSQHQPDMVSPKPSEIGGARSARYGLETLSSLWCWNRTILVFCCRHIWCPKGYRYQSKYVKSFFTNTKHQFILWGCGMPDHLLSKALPLWGLPVLKRLKNVFAGMHRAVMEKQKTGSHLNLHIYICICIIMYLANLKPYMANN